MSDKGDAVTQDPDNRSDQSGVEQSDLSRTMALGSNVAPDLEGSTQATADADVAAPEGLAPGTGLLVVSHGPNAGSRFLLDAPVVTVGRHPDSDIFLDDITVSRRHAEFRQTGSGFTVGDVGSLNGTYLNRHRVDEGALVGGDEIQIGKYRLVFHASTEQA